MVRSSSRWFIPGFHAVATRGRPQATHARTLSLGQAQCPGRALQIATDRYEALKAVYEKELAKLRGRLVSGRPCSRPLAGRGLCIFSPCMERTRTPALPQQLRQLNAG